MKKLRGFIAMRIGTKDTDHFYKKVLAPALRAIDITPIRIDGVEHNEEIDDRIFAEIRKADFLIADLTYARPSAYFEAGFAEGMGTQVIYTVRQDHLGNSPHEESMRVHFDLQMKNIIGWRASAPVEFQRALQRRVRLVLAPQLSERAKRVKEEKEARVFSRLSGEPLDLHIVPLPGQRNPHGRDGRP